MYVTVKGRMKEMLCGTEHLCTMTSVMDIQKSTHVKYSIIHQNMQNVSTLKNSEI